MSDLITASATVLIGDVRQRIAEIPDGSVQCVVTSPPYYGLRDYGHDGQIGHETTPQAYVDEMVAVFREVRRVLKDDGTLWLNLGDSYAANQSNNGGYSDKSTLAGFSRPDAKARQANESGIRRKIHHGLKEKDLIGIPWRVAFALQADGWYLRQDIIWSKPNPMPESVKDRCTKSHEYLFLLTKSPRYYYNAEAIAEPVAPSTVARLAQPNLEQQQGSDRVPGKTNGAMKAVPGSYKGSRFDHGKTADHQLGRAQQGPRFGGSKYGDDDSEQSRTKSGNEYVFTEKRNRRSVWTIATQPYTGAHFAVFPPQLVEPCILAGSRECDTVFDPFTGSGTALEVAQRLGRKALGIELNPDYLPLIRQRLAQQPLVMIGEPA